MENSIMDRLSDEAPAKTVEDEEISGVSPVNLQDGICPLCKEHPPDSG